MHKIASFHILVLVVAKYTVDVEVPIFVDVSLTPFQHFVVGHDVFKHLLSNLGAEAEQWGTALRRRRVDLFDALYPCPYLGSILRRIIDEGAP